MSCRVSVYIAVSLDGYIARPNGELDWLMAYDIPPAADAVYQNFMASVDALVMGRHTYETVLTFDSWPYAQQRVVVLSHQQDLPTPYPVEIRALPPPDLVSELTAQGVQHLYVDGGQTIQQFLQAGLVTDLILTHVPVLLGDGRPLFGPLPHLLPWRHQSTQAFANGLVQSHYGSAPLDELVV